jgi:outer membrane autotransporter protein
MVEDNHVIRDTLLNRLATPASGTAVWAQGFASSGWLDSDGNAARASRNYDGMAGGVDAMLDSLRLGVGGSLGGHKLSVASRGASATGSSGTLFAYAGWISGPITASLGADYGWGDMHIVRAVSALSETETSSRHGKTGEVFAQASYDLPLGQLKLAPYVALDHVNVTTDAFSETGGIAALSGGSASFERTYALMGARAGLDSFDVGGMALTPRVGLSWSYGFGNATPAEALSFKTGQSFLVQGTPAGSDAALVSLGLDLNVLPNLPISLGYDGGFSNRGQTHTIHGGVTWHW